MKQAENNINVIQGKEFQDHRFVFPNDFLETINYSAFNFWLLLVLFAKFVHAFFLFTFTCSRRIYNKWHQGQSRNFLVEWSCSVYRFRYCIILIYDTDNIHLQMNNGEL